MALAMVLAVALAKVSLPLVNSVLEQKIAFDWLGDLALWGALLVATVALGVMAGAYPAFVLSCLSAGCGARRGYWARGRLEPSSAARW